MKKKEKESWRLKKIKENREKLEKMEQYVKEEVIDFDKVDFEKTM